jgi:two-component system, LuxR family, sensor kinase FixL
LIAALEISGQSGGDVVAYQALMLVLAMTGLAIGILVSEQQRTQQQLRLHQEALHRASRLRTMGEFAAAVAHEINQPLTAIANYSRIARNAAEQSPPDVATAARASADVVVQVDRAGAVVHRLRELIRVGKVETSPVAAATLIHETISLCRPELERQGIVHETRIARDLPPVLADALQIEQVLLNVMRNAMEALENAGRHDGRIVIEAAQEVQGMITIRVGDNGPGLDPDLVGQPITAFASTKIDGLGLGLSLSRSIIQAHSGQLRIDSTPGGVQVSFTLPCAQ